jgi:hypothetical protein
MEELATTAPSSDTVPTEQQPEPPALEEELDAPVEAVPEEPPAKAPARAVRIRKPRKASTPSIVIPEIDDRFWANLLATQRDAERATRLQRISEFNLL